MEKEKPNDEKKEVIAKHEEIPATNYRKEHIAFVIKPLHIEQAHRWSQWCEDRGYGKQHNKAFALAMDILEGKTNDIVNSHNRLLSIEKLVHTHDDLIAKIVEHMNDEEDEEEEIDPNEAARIAARQRKERRLNANKGDTQ